MRAARFRWPPLAVSTGEGSSSSEQVSSDDHQMSVSGDGGLGQMFGIGGG